MSGFDAEALRAIAEHIRPLQVMIEVLIGHAASVHDEGRWRGLMFQVEHINKGLEAVMLSIAQATNNPLPRLIAMYAPEQVQVGGDLSRAFWLHTLRPADMLHNIATYESFNPESWADPPEDQGAPPKPGPPSMGGPG